MWWRGREVLGATGCQQKKWQCGGATDWQIGKTLSCEDLRAGPRSRTDPFWRYRPSLVRSGCRFNCRMGLANRPRYAMLYRYLNVTVLRRCHTSLVPAAGGGCCVLSWQPSADHSSIGCTKPRYNRCIIVGVGGQRWVSCAVLATEC